MVRSERISKKSLRAFFDPALFTGIPRMGPDLSLRAECGERHFGKGRRPKNSRASFKAKKDRTLWSGLSDFVNDQGGNLASPQALNFATWSAVHTGRPMGILGGVAVTSSRHNS